MPIAGPRALAGGSRRSGEAGCPRDRLLSETDALGHSESSTYNARNDPATHTDARGLTTAYDCDGQGNIVKRTQPGAVVTSFGRDPAGTGLLKSVTDPRG
jgi:YD repeat-containing protein